MVPQIGRTCHRSLKLCIAVHNPVCFGFVTKTRCFCRVADYWEGYKLFCFAYYSHSLQHETEFQHSKLGSFLGCPAYVLCDEAVRVGCFSTQLGVTTVGLCLCLYVLGVSAGQLVWRRHTQFPPPSHHALRTTCMQLLPLVEMFCKWELQEDCSDLESLMHRFDSESELESHELGRSLLYMIRNDDAALPQFFRHEPILVPGNPFAALRERLAAVDLAIHDLRPQVHFSLIVICRHYTGFKFGVSKMLEFTHSIACNNSRLVTIHA